MIQHSPTFSSDSLDEVAAVQEAVHAMIGRVLRLRCGPVTLMDNGSGFARVYQPSIKVYRNRRWLAMSMAGEAAERLLLGGEVRGAKPVAV